MNDMVFSLDELVIVNHTSRSGDKGGAIRLARPGSTAPHDKLPCRIAVDFAGSTHRRAGAGVRGVNVGPAITAVPVSVAAARPKLRSPSVPPRTAAAMDA